MNNITSITSITSIMKDLVPYSEDHGCFNMFIILYRKMNEEDEDKYKKEERELLSFFTDQFHLICNRLTLENTEEILDDFRELRDDCHEKYEILKKRGDVNIKPFRIIASGEVIGFESCRRPSKKFEYEGFIPCEL